MHPRGKVSTAPRNVLPRLDDHYEAKGVLTPNQVEITDNKIMRKRASQYPQVRTQQCNNAFYGKFHTRSDTCQFQLASARKIWTILLVEYNTHMKINVEVNRKQIHFKMLTALLIIQNMMTERLTNIERLPKTSNENLFKENTSNSTTGKTNVYYNTKTITIGKEKTIPYSKTTSLTDSA